MLKLLTILLLCSVFSGCLAPPQSPPSKLKALIIDGQNNHVVWPRTTLLLKQQLEQTGRFEVTVYRTELTWKGEQWLDQPLYQTPKPFTPVKEPITDPNFKPNFSEYDVVVSNFGWKTAPWPQATQVAFEEYMANGGGFVTIHASNNAFPEWPAYNEINGLGGWGGRNETSGPYIYYNNYGKLIRDLSPGKGGGHGNKYAFDLVNRAKDHPIMEGLPDVMPQVKDELYHHLRGPAKNLTVLATAFDDPEQRGSGRHEPVLMTINYKQGRVFHTTLGHFDSSVESDTFRITFQRGTRWAAGDL